MLCPVDGTSVLVMTERQGIEIDYCPTCRGVWLDRGELDKIIERASAEVAGAAPAPGAGSHQPQPPPPGYPPQGYDQRGYPPPDVRSYPARAYGSKQAYGYRKKKSFLSELFD